MENYLALTEVFLRESISEEQKTVALYEKRKHIAKQYADSYRKEGDEELAKKFDTIIYTLNDIKEEEEVHVGQFQEMLNLLNVSEEKVEEGEKEGKDDIKKFESFVSLANKLKKYI
jgi:hypothetical protein